MPNWKKVIVSGSDASLNSLNVDTSLTASGLIYPTTDGTVNQVIQTDGLGNLSFGSLDTTYEKVKNVSGTTLYKGTPVHATASNASGNVVGIIAASASNPATMPATFILNEDLADEAEGEAIISGLIQGVNTSLFEEGDIVYVGENSGYTNVQPTGSNLIQNLGIVTKIHPTAGSGIVLGAGRSNATPNLLNGEIFWGENNKSIQKPLAHILSGSSFTYSGSFSGSFVGDGSGLTNLAVFRSEAVTDTFTSVTSSIITHALQTENVLVSVYDSSKSYIIPDSIQILDENNVQVGFSTPTTGYAVITNGGHIVSGSIEWDNVLNKPSGIVSSSSQLFPYTGSLEISGSLISQGDILPRTTDIYNLGSPTKRWGDVYLTSASIYLNNTKLSATSDGKVSGSFTGSFVGDGSQLSGVTSYTDSDTLSYINTLGVVSSSAQLSTEISGAFISTSSSLASNISTNDSRLTTLEGKTLVSSSAQITITESQISDLTHYTDSDTLSYINSLDVVSGSTTIPRTDSSNNFAGTQTFLNLVVNGTGSFAYINQVTGSAKIIGDNYIFLNADSPTQRYSGLKIFDSGSVDTGSLEYDSVDNHWFYESTTEGYASGLMAGPRASRGAITWPSNNYILKGTGGNHLGDSIIYESGSNIGIGTNLPSAKLDVVGNTELNGALTQTSGDVNFDNRTFYVDASENKVGIGIPNINDTSNTNLLISQPVSTTSDFITLAAINNNGGEKSRIVWKNRYGTGDFFNGQEASFISSERRSTSGTYDLVFGTASTNSTNASEKVRITNEGDVGIGTTTPQNKLDVEGGAVIGATYSGTNTAPTNGLLVEGNVGIGTTSPSHKLHVKDVSVDIKIESTTGAARNILKSSTGEWRLGTNIGQSNNFWIFEPTLNEYVFNISTAGNVGIGTTNPLNKLHVVGGSISIDADQAIRKAGDNYIIGYSSTLPGINIGSGTATDMVAINAGGQERFRITTTGNVGIGTITPQNKLDVVGAVKIDTDGTYGGGYGTIGFGGTTNGYNRIFGNTSLGDGLFLASATGRSIFFRANGGSIDHMTVASDGNVGIGTTSPSNKLEVSGSTSATTGFNIPSTNLTTSNYGYSNYWSNGVTSTSTSYRLYGPSASGTAFGESLASKAVLTSNSATLMIGSQGFGTSMILGTSGNEAVRIDSSGNVGIGTTSPASKLQVNGTILPGANGTQNLGSSSLRWNTVYTSDLSLKNDVGDWTIVEGEEDLFLYNNKKDKVYKFNITEVDKDSAPKKRS